MQVRRSRKSADRSTKLDSPNARLSRHTIITVAFTASLILMIHFAIRRVHGLRLVPILAIPEIDCTLSAGIYILLSTLYAGIRILDQKSDLKRMESPTYSSMKNSKKFHIPDI